MTQLDIENEHDTESLLKVAIALNDTEIVIVAEGAGEESSGRKGRWNEEEGGRGWKGGGRGRGH